MDYYLPIMREAYPDDYPKRERDLEHFQNLAERYRSLEAMLADMALEPPNDSIGDVLAVEPRTRLRHAQHHPFGKGLEWRVVFRDLGRGGRFPGPMSVGLDELEEERRLMYVASTRARDELYLVLSDPYVRSRDGLRDRPPVALSRRSVARSAAHRAPPGGERPKLLASRVRSRS